MKKVIIKSMMLLACVAGCKQSDSVVDLSTNGTANCYIVSKSGTYSFPAVKGNSMDMVGDVCAAEVLWETYCTSESPMVGDLILAVNYENDRIIFQTPKKFKEGNALIAVKDSDGTILWSWHIWLTDKPGDQIYYNSVAMMDRDLGASDEKENGLSYQWGRKDPFVGYGISSTVRHDEEGYSYKKGTVQYSIAHPTTIITTQVSEYEYVHSGIWERSNQILWVKNKTIYDPCPAGWRIPDSDIWVKTIKESIIDMSFYGNCFSKMSGEGDMIYYPSDHYWSTAPYRKTCFSIFGSEYGDGCDDCDAIGDRGYVRCQKE